jgi:hypothetical protein
LMLFVRRWNLLVLLVLSYILSFSMTWFCIIQIIMVERVATHTVISDSIHGFAFCISNTVVNEYAKGGSTGGTRGEKNITSHKITYCIIIFCFLIKRAFYTVWLNITKEYTKSIILFLLFYKHCLIFIYKAILSYISTCFFIYKIIYYVI